MKTLLQVNSNNASIFDPETGHFIQSVPNNRHEYQDLYTALQHAGSSYGITTEFHYRIYDGPEVTPAILFIYIENVNDLYNLQRAALSGRFAIHLAYILPPRLFPTLTSMVKLLI